MPFDNTKKYLIDSRPVTAKELIDYAKDLEPEWAIATRMFTTSEAAKIIREHGHYVEDGPEIAQANL